MASAESYTAPVADLLTHGAPSHIERSPEAWPDYPATFGLTADHATELRRMVQDPDLNAGDPSTPHVWAPVHAWRALGQLGATDAAEDLCRLCLDNGLDDWVGEEVPVVFAQLGAATLPVLARDLARKTEPEPGRMTLVQAVTEVGATAPSARNDCVAILHDQLAHYADQDDGLNALIVNGLVNFEAREAIETMRDAFTAEAVDIAMLGDVEDAEILLGLRSKRETPPPENPWTTQLRQSAFKALKNDPGFRRDSRRDHDREPAPAGSGPGFPFDTIGDLSDGAAPPAGGAPQTTRKVGRNEPCPCGSGKKAKQCCGAG
jgi:hypothetical protein